MPVKKKRRRQVKKMTTRPLPISRQEVPNKHGVGMHFEFNQTITPTLKIAERLEALAVHLAVSCISFCLGIYYAARGQDFTSVTYRD